MWATVEERRQAFAARRDVLVDGLRAAGFGVPVMPQGAFYIYARSDALDPDSMRLARRLLDEAGVAAVPGSTSATTSRRPTCASPTRPRSTRSPKASAA